MSVIEVNHLTKDYGHGRGIFDVSLKVEKGEVFCFLGPNGAGKTTTIRHLMGFSNPQKGSATINGLSCSRQASKILENVGYLPGEVALPESLTGTQFIHMMQGLRDSHDEKRLKYLLDVFQLDPRGKTKRMSLGNKRKLAVITAFMADPDVLILDEPTSGLDPVMQEHFIDFMKEEKKRGKTILLSSHRQSQRADDDGRKLGACNVAFTGEYVVTYGDTCGRLTRIVQGDLRKGAGCCRHDK